MAPRTPALTPAQAGTIAVACVGVVSAYVPIPAEAQDNITQIVTVAVPSLLGADLGMRVSRAKHLGELLFREGVEAPEPQVPRWVFPALGVAAAVAVGALAALALVLAG